MKELANLSLRESLKAMQERVEGLGIRGDGGDVYAPLTVREAQEIKEAHLAFEEAGGNRWNDWSYEGFP